MANISTAAAGPALSGSPTQEQFVDEKDASSDNWQPISKEKLEEDTDGPSYALAAAPEFPWRYKAPAFICVLLLIVGKNACGSALPPLKSTIRKGLGINNAKYGVIASADSLINTVLPIASGIAIDYYGPEWASIISSTFILVGAVITGLGASFTSFPGVVVGQIILGLGSSTLETAQSKLYTHWFAGSHLGLVYGIDIAFGRVVNTVTRVVTIPIAEGTGHWQWSLWVPACLCGFSLVMNIIYLVLQKFYWPKETRVLTGRDIARGKTEGRDAKKSRKMSLLNVLAIPACFWFILLTQLLQSGTVNAFGSITADAIKQTRGTTNRAAGYTSSFSQVIPIFLTPCLGAVFDKYGRRMHWVTWTASLYVVVFCLLGFTTVNPLVPVILASLALSTNVMPYIASIPILVPSQAHIGTAFGLYKAFNSCGSVIMNVATGAIQDRSPDGPRTYDNVFYFLIALKGVDIIYGLIYHIVDRKYFGSILYMSEKARAAKEEEARIADIKPSGMRVPQKKVTIAGVGCACALIVTAWVVYLVYANGT